ncbi:MAG: thioredoxin [Deltaproteobacteria bacterium]|nr:MAG: thioredoxin [Deltaproteobacteria bacterium]
MKSRTLHAVALAGLCAVACKTGGGAPAGKGGVSIDPGTKVAEMDGQPITYAEMQSDKDVGPKVRQVEVKALTDLYDQRRTLLDEMISRRLLENEAKAKGKTLDQWFQTEYMNSVPDPGDDEVKAFYEEHKGQMPQGQSFEDLKARLKGVVKQQKLRENMGKMLDQLREKHHVQVALQPPELPRVEVEAKGPARGPGSAKVTIVEFSDFQCPYCSREAPVIERLMKEYDGKVRLVFRNYPLDIHPLAAKAAEAGACAADQGKFWEMHDKMFSDQQKLAVEDLKNHAKSLGLDPVKFNKCLDGGEKKPLIDEDQKAGNEAGVNGTPAFFVNGIFINGAVPYDQIKQAVERELKRKG